MTKNLKICYTDLITFLKTKINKFDYENTKS